MCLDIATYPTLNSIRIAAMMTNANGSPVTPVTAKPVVTTPATTVMGVVALSTKKATAGTPSRSRAKARETLLPPAACAEWDMMRTPLLRFVSDCRAVLGALGEHGVAHRRLRVGDEFMKRWWQAVYPPRYVAEHLGVPVPPHRARQARSDHEPGEKGLGDCQLLAAKHTSVKASRRTLGGQHVGREVLHRGSPGSPSPLRTDI